MDGQRRVIHFSGTVQGVGFRYAACQTAAALDITGYVRNCPDGRVECVVEGPPDQIDAFLADLSERMTGCIRDVRQQTQPATGEFKRFGVRY